MVDLCSTDFDQPKFYCFLFLVATLLEERLSSRLLMTVLVAADLLEECRCSCSLMILIGL